MIFVLLVIVSFACAEDSEWFLLSHLDKSSWDCEVPVTCYIEIAFKPSDKAEPTEWYDIGFEIPEMGLYYSTIEMGGNHTLRRLSAMAYKTRPNCKEVPRHAKAEMSMPTSFFVAHGVCFQVVNEKMYRLYADFVEKQKSLIE